MPLRRRLLDLLTALSVLMCVAVAALWVRSYFASDWLQHAPVTERSDGFEVTQLAAHASRGVVSVAAVRHTFAKSAEASMEYEMLRQEYLGNSARAAESPLRSRDPVDFSGQGPLSRWGFTGFRFNTRRPDQRHLGIGWSCPYWFLLVVCGLPPGVRLIARQRRRRLHPRGAVCMTCGYDLTGNVSGVCPECGVAT